MAAYRDSADWLRSGVRSGHLIADTPAELAELAAKLELPQRYFFEGAMLPHWQLPEAFHAHADALGVIFLGREEFTRMAGRVGDRWDAMQRKATRRPTSSEEAPKALRRTSKASRKDKRGRAPAPTQGALW